MAGNTGMKTIPILRENKVTLYRLHPTEFGRIMRMPNLPNGLHEAESFRNKGWKLNPQELMLDAKLETNPEGEQFLVPEGYKLKSKTVKALTDKDRSTMDADEWVVEKEKAPLYVKDK